MVCYRVSKRLLNASLSGRFEFIDSGDFKDISRAGVYYISNDVVNKPNSTGGLYVLGWVDETNNVGLYISSDSSIQPIVCRQNKEIYRLQKNSAS